MVVFQFRFFKRFINRKSKKLYVGFSCQVLYDIELDLIVILRNLIQSFFFYRIGDCSYCLLRVDEGNAR